jgi:hypothetical protein
MLKCLIQLTAHMSLKCLIVSNPIGRLVVRARRVDPDPDAIGSGSGCGSKIFDLSGPGPKIFVSPGPGPGSKKDGPDGLYLWYADFCSVLVYITMNFHLLFFFFQSKIINW